MSIAHGAPAARRHRAQLTIRPTQLWTTQTRQVPTSKSISALGLCILGNAAPPASCVVLVVVRVLCLVPVDVFLCLFYFPVSSQTSWRLVLRRVMIMGKKEVDGGILLVALLLFIAMGLSRRKGIYLTIEAMRVMVRGGRLMTGVRATTTTTAAEPTAAVRVPQATIRRSWAPSSSPSPPGRHAA